MVIQLLCLSGEFTLECQQSENNTKATLNKNPATSRVLIRFQILLLSLSGISTSWVIPTGFVVSTSFHCTHHFINISPAQETPMF